MPFRLARLAGLLAVLASTPVLAGSHARKPDGLITLSRQFVVEVDAQGQVNQVRPDPDLPRAVIEAIAA